MVSASLAINLEGTRMESRQVATLLRPHGLVGSSPMPSAPALSLWVSTDSCTTRLPHDCNPCAERQVTGRGGPT